MKDISVSSQLAKRPDAMTLKFENLWYWRGNGLRFMDLAKFIKSMKKVRRVDICFKNV